VDVTTAATLGAMGGIALSGIAVYAVRLSERQQRRVPPLPEAPPALPDGIADVLAVLRSSGIVLDSADSVVNNSPAAVANGLVRGQDLTQPELLEVARLVRRDGVIREVELELPKGPAGRPGLVVGARVAPLGSAHVLLLVDDRSEARRLEEIRRDFVANVSHELKTPVGGLALLAEAVLDAHDDPEAVARFAQRMQVESTRLTRLVQEIVDLSRLQVAASLSEPHPVDLAQAAQEAVDRSRLAAEDKDIEIALVTAGDCSVWGDHALLVTAIRNLVGNAVAYSEPNTRVAVTVRAVSGDHDGRPAAHLRALLPCRRRPLADHRGHRAGSVDRQARRCEPRRRGVGVVRARTRLDIHPPPARHGPRPPARRRLPPDRRHRHDPPRHPQPTGSDPRVSRILVVEDEESYSDPLSYLLRREGYEVAVAETGPAALAQFDKNGADLVLLDLMLPGLSGVDVCRQLRQRSSVPVIMLTAKDSEIDKVVGLEIGADDYVTKPYSSRELLARIKAVLRRLSEPEELVPQTLESGPVRMDVERHTVTVGGTATSLPLKEFELLEMLLRNAGRVLTRMQLIDRVWGSDYVGDTKTLDVHVKRLRAKIEPDPANPRHIVTVRGLGYKFEAA
jgi:two-component system response regulator RegX3